MPHIPSYVIVVSGLVTGLGVIVTLRYTLHLQHQKQALEEQQEQRRCKEEEERREIADQQRRYRRRRRRRRRQLQDRRSSRRSTEIEEDDDEGEEGQEDWLFPLHLNSDESEEEDDEEIDDGDTSNINNRNSSLRRTEASPHSNYPTARGNRLLTLFSEWEDEDDSDSKNLLQLLRAISENQARKEGYIHRGITCNKCAVSPIRGIRYKCANCVDFDLCDMCEASNGHHHTHVFLKIRIPIPPLANPRSALLPPFYPGKNDMLVLSPEQAQLLEAESHFDQVELEALFAQYKSLSVVESSQGGINQVTFEQCLGPLGMEKNLITERIFAFFDRDRDGIITFPELVQGLSVLCKGNLDEKIEYAFNGYDLDEDGYISRDELYWMFKSYFYLSMELVRDVVSAMEDDMMDNYEFPAGQPVSSAFNVPIPSTSSDDDNENTSNGNDDGDDNDNGDGDDDNDNDSEHQDQDGNRNCVRRHRLSRLSRRHPSQETESQPYAQKQDYFASVYNHGQASSQREESLGDTTEYDNGNEDEDDSNVDGGDDDDEEEEQEEEEEKHMLQPNLFVRDIKDNKEPTKLQWEEKFPIMETMAQDAIHEMVNKTFRNMTNEREGYISFDEFKQCVQTDSSIVSWFEALGTVF